MAKDRSAEAHIKGNKIIIYVNIENLPCIVEGQWAAGYSDIRYKVTNPEVFAKELTHELNKEREDGTTPIHVMFDKCILEAIDQGAQGIEEHENQEE